MGWSGGGKRPVPFSVVSGMPCSPERATRHSGTGKLGGCPVAGGYRRRRWSATVFVTCLLAGDYADGRSAGATTSGAFETAVEALFLSFSRAVETSGQAGRALQVLWSAVSEKFRA